MYLLEMKIYSQKNSMNMNTILMMLKTFMASSYQTLLRIWSLLLHKTSKTCSSNRWDFTWQQQNAISNSTKNDTFRTSSKRVYDTPIRPYSDLTFHKLTFGDAIQLGVSGGGCDPCHPLSLFNDVQGIHLWKLELYSCHRLLKVL